MQNGRAAGNVTGNLWGRGGVHKKLNNLAEDEHIIHVASWHQIQNEEQFGKNLLIMNL